MGHRRSNAVIAVLMVSLLLIPMLIGCMGSERPSNSTAVDRAGGQRLTKAELDALEKVDGHLVYVSVYSHIYHQEDQVFYLTATLSIRNTDVNKPIYVTSVTYHDTTGALVREYIREPLKIPPLATLEYIVGARDTEGGSGANFLVDWQAADKVAPPVIECIMISTSSQQGISFRTEGVNVD